MSKNRRRAQAPKPYVERVQNLRGGSTAQPHRNRKRYTRKGKTLDLRQEGW